MSALVSSQKRGVLAIAGVLLILAGCQTGGGPQGGGFKPAPMPVEMAPVSQGEVADRFESVGSVEAGEAILVVSEIDAAVTKLPFQEGQPVRAGALLAQLDDGQLRAEVMRTEAL